MGNLIQEIKRENKNGNDERLWYKVVVGFKVCDSVNGGFKFVAERHTLIIPNTTLLQSK